MVDQVKGEIDEIDLDSNLDDLEDLPAFAVPLSGAYMVDIEKLEGDREINEKKHIACDFKVVEVLEVTEEPEVTDEPAKVGDIFSQAWSRSNKFAMGSFKKIFAPVKDRLGVQTLNEVIQQGTGVRCMLVCKRFRDKKDKTIWRMRIIKMAPV